MVSPLGDRTNPKSSDSVYEVVLSQFQGDLVERLNVEQLFILIDGVLPFEACLYYQVLPLFIEGSRLHLGMVSPKETSAIDYVRRIISYHNYSLVPQPISSEALQAVLSAYLNYSGKQQKKSSEPGTSNPDNRSRRSPARARTNQTVDPNIQATFVVDSPEEITVNNFAKAAPISTSAPPPQVSITQITLSAPASNTHLQPEADTPTFEIPSKIVAEVPEEEEEQATPSNSPSLLSPLPPLDIQTNYLSKPVECLATLPPRILVRELLGRVLHSGIGRLYFERQPEHGRVRWSQDGVLQSILDQVNVDVFQQVINELKLLTHLPLLPTQKAQQVEIERLYQGTRLLLRFKFMAAVHGEEVMLQVLRGAALKLYQQQQLANLERDAITIAKQLQTKLSEIRDRAHSEAGLTGARLDALPALSQLIKNIEHQLGSLQANDNDSPDP